MGGHNLQFTPFFLSLFFFLLLLFLFPISVRAVGSFGADCSGLGLGPHATPPPPPPSGIPPPMPPPNGTFAPPPQPLSPPTSPPNDDICKNVNCVEGTCVPSYGSTLGFDCVCHPGWKKLQLGYLVVLTCMFPNCTIYPQCGDGAPSPSPSPSLALPRLNISDPCNLLWCGDGSCVANGTDHNCKCNEGSFNLLNLTHLPCFKPCSFGPDCSGLGFGPQLIPPPPPMLGILPPPPPFGMPPPPQNGTFAPPPQLPSPPNGRRLRGLYGKIKVP